jgi:SAM-dependent methyltransferase
MLIRFLVFLCGLSPAFRRLLWRWWYGRLAKKFTVGSWTFMNYGFAPPDGPPLRLDPADEPDRLCIQLYERVAAPAALADAEVLEVGSGRGGGASYLARHHRPKKFTGADYSPQAVALCRSRHAAVPHLAFAVGDAENLPFPAASFDVVVNVESSHCYGHLDRFFAEVVRVLRPGGRFAYTDFRDAAGLAALETALAAQPGWEPLEREDITGGVFAALEADDARKRRLIAELCPPRLQPVFGEFAGLAGGEIHTGFRARTLHYHRYLYRKK